MVNIPGNRNAEIRYALSPKRWPTTVVFVDPRKISDLSICLLSAGQTDCGIQYSTTVLFDSCKLRASSAPDERVLTIRAATKRYVHG